MVKDVEGIITFTYHDDLEKTSSFYRDVPTLQLIMERDWVKIYKAGSDSHISLVDSGRGYLKPSKEKPVMLSIMVRDIDA